jgi:hypothetical protein
VLFYFHFLPVNPRLCAAISNLRSNKGGKSKEKKIVVVVIAATSAMDGLRPFFGSLK